MLVNIILVSGIPIFQGTIWNKYPWSLNQILVHLRTEQSVQARVALLLSQVRACPSTGLILACSPLPDFPNLKHHRYWYMVDGITLLCQAPDKCHSSLILPCRVYRLADHSVQGDISTASGSPQVGPLGQVLMRAPGDSTLR